MLNRAGPAARSDPSHKDGLPFYVWVPPHLASPVVFICRVINMRFGIWDENCQRRFVRQLSDVTYVLQYTEANSIFLS